MLRTVQYFREGQGYPKLRIEAQPSMLPCPISQPNQSCIRMIAVDHENQSILLLKARKQETW
jgi:hypothetical protein